MTNSKLYKTKILFTIFSMYCLFLNVACNAKSSVVLTTEESPAATAPTPDSAESPPAVVPSGYVCGNTSISALGTITATTAGDSGQSIYVSGNYSYFGTTGAVNTGIQIVDITNPSIPVNKAFITTQSGVGKIDSNSNDILDIIVDNNILYASTYAGGLLIANVSDPTTPVILSALNLDGETWGISKSGNYVYVG